MGKKLLTYDIDKIVLKSFTIQEIDHFDYYSNIIEEHSSNDVRIIEKLKNSINGFIDLYLSKSKSDKSCVPLSEFGIPFSYNMAYYERVLKIIEDIESQKKIEMIDYLIDRTSKFNYVPDQKLRYIIKSDDLIQHVYDICNTAFDCEYLIFRDSIETANFDLLKIKKQIHVQDLTYRLSGIMDGNWYVDICKKMKWTKSVCSGQGSKLEFDLMTIKLNKTLPRPSKK